MSHAEMERQLVSLRKRLRVTAIVLAGIAACLLGRVLWGQSPSGRKIESLTVQTLRLVDAQGRPRMIFGMPLGNPQVEGKVYPRSVPVYGLQFLDASGNETGGLGFAETKRGEVRLLCFDWNTVEAMCITKTGESTSISMYQKPEPGSPVGKIGPERIAIESVQGAARIVLRDGAGKERIVLGTDAQNNAEIKMLSANGKVVFQAPSR